MEHGYAEVLYRWWWGVVGLVLDGDEAAHAAGVDGEAELEKTGKDVYGIVGRGERHEVGGFGWRWTVEWVDGRVVAGTEAGAGEGFVGKAVEEGL